MDQLNAAVIGCGKHAGSHFRMIADEPRVRLAAIAEIDPQRLERAAAEHQPDRAFLDYREMLDTSDLDLVYAVTMPGHLMPIVLDCLERDLHVSVEKSPGMNSIQAPCWLTHNTCQPSSSVSSTRSHGTAQNQRRLMGVLARPGSAAGLPPVARGARPVASPFLQLPPGALPPHVDLPLSEPSVPAPDRGRPGREVHAR